MAKSTKDPQEALKKVTAQLECGICLDEYKDPKLLSCFHVFCKQCLEPLVLQRREQSLLDCPNCRHTTVLPPQGVKGLRPDFRMHHLFEIRDALTKAKEPEKTQCENCKKPTATRFCRDCGKFLCDRCTELHQLWDEFTNHQIVPISDLQSEAASLIPPTKGKVMPCKKHPENLLKIYCETCNELICIDCTIRLHQGHQYDLISDTFPKHKQELVNQLEPVKHHLATVNQALSNFDARSQEIHDQRAAIQADIHKEIDQLHQALEQRRTELIGQLDQLTQHKLKSLAAQRDQVELLHTQLASCLEYVEGSLKTGTQGEILGMKAPVLKQIQRITTGFNQDTLVPEEEANMLLASDDIPFLNRPCPQIVLFADKSCISEGMNSATVGELATVTVRTFHVGGKEYQLPVKSLTAELVCCSDNATMECEVRWEGDSKYEIQYQPVTRGQHQLHIRINGKSIKGSPYAVMARPPLQSLGKPVRTITNLQKPWGIATDSKGRIIIAESGADCISILTQQGHKIQSFGSKGKGNGQFGIPRGIAVDANDNIFVVDRINHRIQKFTSAGKFIASAGSDGANPLQFNRPFGIAFNSKNSKIYVCDECNHRIQILNADLTFSSSFGSRGTADGKFNFPVDVAFDSRGNIYIADCHNHRVQVFTPEGKFLHKFGSEGEGDGELSSVASIAIDESDTVYITERNSHRVSIFTTKGQFQKCFGSHGQQEGEFHSPWTIRIDKDGFVLVSDTHNNRLQIF